jgi:hypothetical protein
MRFHKLSLSIALVGLCGLAGSNALADPATVQYMVTVNTSSVLAQMGYIDFQLNPSGLATQPANADVANFFTDGVLNPADAGNGSFGEVSGMLPGTVTLINSETTNEYTEAMTFGTTITFDLDLYGPALSNPNGEGGGSFYLTFYNSDFSGNLLTTNPNGDALEIDINGDGTTSVAYESPDVTLSGPVFVPEPGSLTLLLCGSLAALAVLGRRRLAKRTI